VGWWILRLTERDQREQQRGQLITAIRTLRQALANNCDAYGANLDEGYTQTDALHNTATWDVVRPQLSQGLQDYQLLADIATYYSRVGVLHQDFERLIDLTMGNAATIPDAAAHRLGLRRFLSRRLMELKGDAERIINQLDAKEKALTAKEP
jgi:hypothetical protein